MILHYWSIQTNIFDYSSSNAYIHKIADVLDGLFYYAKCQNIKVKISYVKYTLERCYAPAVVSSKLAYQLTEYS